MTRSKKITGAIVAGRTTDSSSLDFWSTALDNGVAMRCGVVVDEL